MKYLILQPATMGSTFVNFIKFCITREASDSALYKGKFAD